MPLKKRSMSLNEDHEEKGCKITYTCTRPCGSVIEVNVINDIDYLDSMEAYFEKQLEYHTGKSEKK